MPVLKLQVLFTSSIYSNLYLCSILQFLAAAFFSLVPLESPINYVDVHPFLKSVNKAENSQISISKIDVSITSSYFFIQSLGSSHACLFYLWNGDLSGVYHHTVDLTKSVVTLFSGFPMEFTVALFRPWICSLILQIGNHRVFHMGIVEFPQVRMI